MNYDAIWQTFTDTGDPMGYLLFKAAAGPPRTEKKTAGPGDMTRPED